MDGFEVIDGLKASAPEDDHLPVLVITAQPGHKLRALQAGAKDFVSKPFDLAEVLMRVRNMLEVRLLHLDSKQHGAVLEQTLREVEASREVIRRQAEVAARLLPAFLARRVKDLALIDQELARDGYRAIERVGHNLKGIGRNYGVDGISEIGAVLEQAGQQHDATEIRKQATALAEYLRRVQIAPA